MRPGRQAPVLFRQLEGNMAVDAVSHRALRALARHLNNHMDTSFLTPDSPRLGWESDGQKVAFVGRLNIPAFGSFKNWLMRQSKGSQANFVFLGHEHAKIGHMITTLPPSPTLQIHLVPRPPQQQPQLAAVARRRLL